MPHSLHLMPLCLRIALLCYVLVHPFQSPFIFLQCHLIVPCYYTLSAPLSLSLCGYVRVDRCLMLLCHLFTLHCRILFLSSLSSFDVIVSSYYSMSPCFFTPLLVSLALCMCSHPLIEQSLKVLVTLCNPYS